MIKTRCKATQLLMYLLFSIIPYSLFAYKIINPTPYGICRTDYINCQVSLEEGDIQPDSILFNIVNTDLYKPWSKLVRSDDSYAYIFDSKNLYDGIYYVQAKIFINNKVDTIGTKIDKRGIPFMIDRNKTFKQQTLSCIFLKKRSNLIREMKASKKQKFICNNNSIEFSGMWDKNFLYLLFWINDQHLNSAPYKHYMFGTSEKDYFVMLWEADGIEISFDVDHNHSEWKMLDDYELLMDINAQKQGNIWDRKLWKFAHWGDSVQVRTEIHGTIDKNTDVDRGYDLLVSIPWHELEMKPKSGKSLGFDVQLFDRDFFQDGMAYRTSWTGLQRMNNDNTSEWGNLVLVKKNKLNIWFILGIIGGIVAIFIFFLLSKKRNKKTSVSTHKEHHIIKDIKKYIDQNFSDTEFSITKLASEIGKSPNYLSNFFKKETGIAITQYLNQVRICKSKELLIDHRKNISEIAFEVGFNSVQHFNRVFKSMEGKTPGKCREK